MSPRRRDGSKRRAKPQPAPPTVGGGGRILLVSTPRATRDRVVPILVRVWGQGVRVESEPSRLDAAVRELEPTVVLLDAAGPDAIAHVEALLAEVGIPVVVLRQPEAPSAEAFLAVGVVAVEAWPVFDADPRRFLHEVRVLSSARVVRGLRVRSQPPAEAVAVTPPAAPLPAPPVELTTACAAPAEPAFAGSGQALDGLVCIGGSSGAPTVLRAILQSLPASLEVPILVVQHHHPEYSRVFVDWLDQGPEGSLPVRIAEDGEALARGVALFAPGDRHLVVDGETLRLDDGPPVRSSKPSVDVLLRTAAPFWGARSLVVILSGMGRDGADGAVAVSRAGGRVVVQDEETSGIFGMPRSVIEAGVADEVLSPEGLVEEIRRFVVRLRRGEERS